MLNRQLLKDSIGWGFVLWLIGYILGFVFFAFVPQRLLGWVITPIGLLITLWVLFKKIKSKEVRYYCMLSLVWVFIAIVFDYFFLVKVLKPSDGYYKLDVYLYYFLTCTVPIAVGLWKSKITKNVHET